MKAAQFAAAIAGAMHPANTEVLDGNGMQRIEFDHGPNVAIVSLTIDGLPIPNADDAQWRVGYRVTPGELHLRGYVFTRREQNVVVVYRAEG